MIPIRDIIPSRTTPWVNLFLIAVNALVFFHEAFLGPDEFTDFLFRFGLVPADFSLASATTSMFVHASLLHVGTNLLSLWIFGDNVEDQLGHARYLAFYLLAGYAAGLTEVMAGPDSAIPVVGASGAIAGVMGAYLVMFPRSRVLVLVPVFFVFDLVEIPAVLFLGLWFLIQVLGGVGRLAMGSTGGGVAFWAHLGGFVAGVIMVAVFRQPSRRRVDWWGA